MISKWLLLLLIPACWLGFFYAALLSAGKCSDSYSEGYLRGKDIGYKQGRIDAAVTAQEDMAPMPLIVGVQWNDSGYSLEQLCVSCGEINTARESMICQACQQKINERGSG